MGMGADSDGPGGAGGGSDSDNWDEDGFGALDFGGDPSSQSYSAYGGENSTGRGGVGDDPTVPGGGWPGSGSQYSPSGQWEDQPDVQRNIANEIMSRVIGSFAAFGSLVGFKGAIDPLSVYDLVQDAIYSLFGGKWTSFTYHNPGAYNDIGAFNTTGSGGNGAVQTQANEIANAVLLNLQRARSLSSGTQLSDENTPYQARFVEPISYNKWVAPPSDKQEVFIQPLASYSIFNFPPPQQADVYTQPKTSIWYV